MVMVVGVTATAAWQWWYSFRHCNHSKDPDLYAHDLEKNSESHLIEDFEGNENGFGFDDQNRQREKLRCTKTKKLEAL